MILFNYALVQKRLKYAAGHEKVILLHNFLSPPLPPSDTRKRLKERIIPVVLWAPFKYLTGKSCSSTVLIKLDPSDYHLVLSMSHILFMKHFKNYGDVEKWLDDWITSKHVQVFWRGIRN